MIKTLMPKDFQAGDYFEFPGVDTWFKVNHVDTFDNGSVFVWTPTTNGRGIDLFTFFKDEGPYIVRRPEGF